MGKIKRKHIRRKDIERIYDDVNIESKRQKLENQEIDVDLPGEGQFYCIPCARHFTSEETRAAHIKTKKHKRRMVLLKVKPYTVDESMGLIDNGKKLYNNLADKDKPVIEMTV